MIDGRATMEVMTVRNGHDLPRSFYNLPSFSLYCFILFFLSLNLCIWRRKHIHVRASLLCTFLHHDISLHFVSHTA